MGAVYRATDAKLNRDVAIKLLPEEVSSDPDWLARFTREAQVLASLNHPNIVLVFDRGVTAEGRAYLVSELVEGATLREERPARLRRAGRVKILDFGLAHQNAAHLRPSVRPLARRSPPREP